MKVAVVHYHARRGGVTRVIERAVESLGGRVELLFFTGEAPPADAPLESIIRVVPGLGYSAARPDTPPDLCHIARDAFGCDPDLWHIHNHSLGKNSVLPGIVNRLAAEGRPLLLQIHDFAEDGRPGNYRRIGPDKDRLYPVASHVHYAVLNQRDAAFLQSAGIPQETLHLLPNSASPPALAATKRKEGPPLYVYPVRAIRRKNIGELLFWSCRMPNARFAVTLAPENPEALAVYRAWESFAAERGLRVEFNASTHTPFHELIARADALITTSIAEGFGLAFLEPWLAGKPLAGRDLPEITSDFTAHGLDLSALYTRLSLPLANSAWDLREPFRRALEAALRDAYAAYERPWTQSVLGQAEMALVQDGGIDFGVLNEEMQRTVLCAMQDDPALLESSLDITSDYIEQNRRVVETAYSSWAYGETLEKIYQLLAAETPGPVSQANGQRLLDEFLAPGRINLLRT